MTPVYEGRFNDGLSAARRAVRVRLDDAALVLLGDDDTALAAWPYPDLSLVDGARRGRPMRLASATDPDARLTIDATVADRGFRDSLLAIAPHLRRRGLPGTGRRALALWVVGTAAAVALLVFAAPRLAAPVAALIPAAWEAEMGERITDQILADASVCDAPAGTAALARLVDRLASSLDTPYTFDVRVADIGQVNAFAAPGGHIVIFRGLLEFARTADEAAGVLAHEMAHVVERHATEAIIRAAGLSFVFEVLTGGSMLAGFGEMLIGLSFSRGAEAEADAVAIDILAAADIRAAGLAQFLARLDEKGSDIPEGLSFLSTHPTSSARAEAIAAASGVGRPAMPPADWRAIQAMCR